MRDTSPSSATLAMPFAPLPPLDPERRAALEAEALRANDRYLHEVVEGHALCPFARHGRLMGETSRHVVFAGPSATPLVELMATIAADPRQVVAQVIFPLVDVDPDAWIRFCDDVTKAGHERIGGPPVLAFAALHPRLRWDDRNPYAMIPLFRRAPDPTLQWVRLDGIAAIYAGRDTEERFVDRADVLAFVRDAGPPKPALYDHVAEVNAKTARALGLAKLEALLEEMAVETRERGRRLLEGRPIP
jgi:hypothetical protein